MNKKNLIKFYNLEKEIKYCKKCTVSNQRPRISFDKNGTCSACNFAIYKRNKIDWKLREKKLVELCNKFRSKDGSFDVLVPCSGGKDGSFTAHQLKYKYGMNPLCVTWSPLQYTEIGKKNLEAFIKSGFHHILGTPDYKVTRKLTQLSLKELGDPFQPFIYGQVNFPLSIAIKFGISLIMYGENQEAEYGGDITKAEKPTRDIDDFGKYYFLNSPVKSWVGKDFSIKDLNYFIGPDIDQIKKNKTEIHFLGYYKFWDPQENFYYCQEHTGFTPNTERTEGTYSKYASIDDMFDGFHFYLAYIKFGIGRTTSDSSHEIRDGKINREEGIALVKKYDGEFPHRYFTRFLDYCSISDQEFNKIIDSWRSEHVWHKGKNGKWELKNPIWKTISSNQ